MTDALTPEVYEGDSMLEAIAGRIELVVDDPEAIAIEITNRIMSATSVDEVLAPRGTLHAADVLNTPLTVLGVRWQRSDLSDGYPVYAVIDAKIANSGESVVVTCGARNVMAALVKLEQFDAFPIGIAIREAEKATSKGYKPMWIERADEAF